MPLFRTFRSACVLAVASHALPLRAWGDRSGGAIRTQSTGDRPRIAQGLPVKSTEMRRGTPESTLRWQRQGRIWGWLHVRTAGRDLGRWGEWVALRHLRRLGWDILARNWRGRRGEVDLIAQDGAFLVFVEVKTRRLPAPLPSEDQVGLDKERRLESLALEFCLRYGLTGHPFRLDLVAVETENFGDYRLRHYVG